MQGLAAHNPSKGDKEKPSASSSAIRGEERFDKLTITFVILSLLKDVKRGAERVLVFVFLIIFAFYFNDR